VEGSAKAEQTLPAHLAGTTLVGKVYPHRPAGTTPFGRLNGVVFSPPGDA